VAHEIICGPSYVGILCDHQKHVQKGIFNNRGKYKMMVRRLCQGKYSWIKRLKEIKLNPFSPGT
jgi:hypothetical protein